MSTPQPISERYGKSSENILPDELMSRLFEFQPQETPVVSLYLDARTNENGKRTFAPFVRKRMTEVARTFAPHTAERESFDEDFVRIERYLEEGPTPATQGIAIFSCSAANDFFDVGQFNAPFTQNRLSVADRPHLYPLARMADQYRRYAVLVADRNRANIFVFACGNAIAKREIENVDTKEPRWSGFTQDRFQHHVEDFQSRHAKEVVELLERIVREDQIDEVILAGDHETVMPLLREQMSKELANKVIDTLSLPMDTSAQQVLEETSEAIRRHNSLSDVAKVERLMNEYRADDLAVVGVPLTIAALSNGQVEELLIASAPAELNYDEGEVLNVLQLYNVDDQPLPQLDKRSIADELVRRADKLSSARVTFIEDPTQLSQVGGVGALLRYRISSDRAAPYEEGNAVPRSEALVEV